MGETEEVKLCKRGHARTPENTGKTGRCTICKQISDRRRRENNPDKARENSRRRRENNPDKARESDRKWRENNPDKARERHRKWRENNPDKVREHVKKWCENNPDKVRERYRKWRENNPDKVREHNKKMIEQIPDCYAARRLGMRVSTAPPDLIEMKRKRILEKRALRELKKAMGGN